MWEENYSFATNCWNYETITKTFRKTRSKYTTNPSYERKHSNNLVLEIKITQLAGLIRLLFIFCWRRRTYSHNLAFFIYVYFILLFYLHFCTGYKYAIREGIGSNPISTEHIKWNTVNTRKWILWFRAETWAGLLLY